MELNNESTGAEKEQIIEDFSAAWRRKDIETLMAYITDDCVYGASVGPEPGATYVGRDEVRRVLKSCSNMMKRRLLAGAAFGSPATWDFPNGHSFLRMSQAARSK